MSLLPIKNSVERDILECLGRILLTEQDMERAKSVLGYVYNNAMTTFELLKKNKVLTIFYTNLQRLQAAYPGIVDQRLFERSEHSVLQALEHTTASYDEMQRLTAIAQKQLGIDILLLKGYSVQRFYPPPYKRWMNDIDFMVRDIESAFKLYELMIGEGYTLDKFEVPWLKKVNSDFYGHIILTKSSANDYSRFDIHYNRYSISYSGFLETDFWKEEVCTTIENLDPFILTPNACMLILFAHMLSDGFIRMKDINDTVSLLLTNQIDWPSLATHFRHHQLEVVAISLLRHVGALYNDHRIQMSIQQAQQSLGSVQPRLQWPLYQKRWAQRALLNSIYTYCFERYNRRVGYASSLKSALECYLYFLQHFHASTRRRTFWEYFVLTILSKPALIEGKLTNKTCVRLFAIRDGHMNISLYMQKFFRRYEYCAGRLIYLENEAGGILVSNNHIFIPTLDLILDKRLIEEIESLPAEEYP